MSLLLPARFRRALVLTVVAAVALVGLPVLASAPATAAPVYATPALHQTFRGGPGHPLPVIAGFWNWNGRRGFCIDFPRHKPDGLGTAPLTGRPVPGMTAAESARAKTIANRYVRTRSAVTAANAQFAIWVLQNDSTFRTWWAWARRTGVVPAARAAQVSAILAESQQHGPYRVSVTATPVLVGQTGRGTATVRASNGRPAPGLAVAVTANPRARILSVNGRAGTTGVTNRNGNIAYTFQRTNLGPPLLRVTATAPSAQTSLLTLPSAGNQRLIVGGFNESAFGQVSFERVLGRPQLSATCTTDCTGAATVTVRAGNPAGSRPVRYTWRVAGRQVASLVVGGGRTGATSVRLLDGSQVTAEYCYVGTATGPCTSATVRLPGATEVVCPAWVATSFTGQCPCEGGTRLAFTLTIPATTPRAYRVQVVRDESVVQTLDLPKGRATTTAAVQMSAGTRVQVRFTAYRSVVSGAPAGALRSGTLADLTTN